MSDKKKTSKFKVNWKYALGEVAIVSTGILLAFQLNSWKENSRNSEIEISSLLLLENELRQDSSILFQYYYQANLHKADAAAMLSILQMDNAIEFSDSLANCYRRSGFYSASALHQSAFKMMIGQGSLNLIQNDSLRNSIYRYYDRTHKVVEIWNDFQKNMADNIIPPLYDKGLIDDKKVLETSGLRIFYIPELFVAELQKTENKGRIATYMRAQNDIIGVTNLNRRINARLMKDLRVYLKSKGS